MNPIEELTKPRFPFEKVFLMSLGLAFIVLKLCKVIDWPWIWVLTPLWIAPAFVVAFIFVIIFIMLMVVGINRIRRYWRNRNVGRNRS